MPVVVFHVHGTISTCSCETYHMVRWDITIPVVLRSSYERGMKTEKILWEGGMLPVSPGLAEEVFSRYEQARRMNCAILFQPTFSEKLTQRTIRSRLGPWGGGRYLVFSK